MRMWMRNHIILIEHNKLQLSGQPPVLDSRVWSLRGVFHSTFALKCAYPASGAHPWQPSLPQPHLNDYEACGNLNPQDIRVRS